MYRRFAFLALPLLLAYAPIDDVLAGDGNSGKSTSAHPGPRHAISPRHHATGHNGNNGVYYSLRQQAKSDWRQARHGGNHSAPVRTGGGEG